MAGANTFKLEVITPDRIFYTGEAQMVELTTTEGDVGIYAEHIPMTAIVGTGNPYDHRKQGFGERSFFAGRIY